MQLTGAMSDSAPAYESSSKGATKFGDPSRPERQMVFPSVEEHRDIVPVVEDDLDDAALLSSVVASFFSTRITPTSSSSNRAI